MADVRFSPQMVIIFSFPSILYFFVILLESLREIRLWEIVLKSIMKLILNNLKLGIW